MKMSSLMKPGLMRIENREEKNLNEKEKLMNSFPTCGVHGVT